MKKKTIWNKLHDLLPVSRKAHEAALAEAKTKANQTVNQMRSGLQSEFKRKAAKLDEIVAKLSTVRWAPDGHGHLPQYAMQLNVSAEMLHYTTDPHHRDMIAESLGHRVAAEIRSSKFIH